MIPKALRATYSIFMFFRLFPLLRHLRNEGRCDLISAHWLYPDGVASAAAARLLEIPIYLHAMGSDINEYSKFFLRRIQIVKAIESADAIITKSRALASRVLDLGVSKTQIHTVPNGIDRSIFYPGDKDEARKLLNIPGDSFSILYVGNFNKEKNVSLLIRAFAEVVKVRPKAKLLLVGDGPERKMLERLAANNVSGGNIIFAGRQAHHSLRRFYQAADCFALPSTKEGCPNVLLEALSCGLSVIASNVGGVPEIVTQEYGKLVESGNLEEWVQALESAVSNPPGPVAKFEWPSWADNADLLKEIFSGR